MLDLIHFPFALSGTNKHMLYILLLPRSISWAFELASWLLSHVNKHAQQILELLIHNSWKLAETDLKSVKFGYSPMQDQRT